jgi:hypothetical protein
VRPYEREDLGELALPSDERRELRRQVRGVEAPKRRELRLAELVEVLRLPEILEPMQAEVSKGRRAGE